MTHPKSVPELIDAFGGATAFARILDTKPSTASEMKRSGSIRVVHWPRIISAAPEHGISVSAESLMRMHLDEVGA